MRTERESERENERGVRQGGTREDEALAVARAEDRALMARVQTGDEAAFGALMERWERPVKSVIARLVFNVTEADELAQETMVRVWQQREKFQVGAEVRPWVFSIAVNLARKLGVDAETALAGANKRFAARFRHIEQTLRSEGREVEGTSLEELDRIWEQAKNA